MNEVVSCWPVNDFVRLYRYVWQDLKRANNFVHQRLLFASAHLHFGNEVTKALLQQLQPSNFWTCQVGTSLFSLFWFFEKECCHLFRGSQLLQTNFYRYEEKIILVISYIIYSYIIYSCFSPNTQSWGSLPILDYTPACLYITTWRYLALLIYISSNTQ